MDGQNTVREFVQCGEWYAAGFYECPDRNRFYRHALAHRRYLENCRLPEYRGGRLYPCGRKWPEPCAVSPDYSYTFHADWDSLKKKTEAGYAAMREEAALLPPIDTVHTVGGAGYTHAIPNYKRVIKEGLDSYLDRIRGLPDGDFRAGLLELMDGIRGYCGRCVEHLRSSGAGERLIDALRAVPFSPARDLYEAAVCWNLLFYLDSCDNPGRLDADLIEYHRGEDATALIREFYGNVDANDGWSGALGPDCNPLTLQCLEAAKGLRRPSLELRVTEAMPDEVWQAAAEALETGCGQPALYNEPAYQEALRARFPYIPKEDLLRFNGGGCTETMLAGVSNVGSLDAGINLAFIFSEYMRQRLGRADSFEGFLAGLVTRIRLAIRDTCDIVNRFRKDREEYRPNPMRSLLIDDCIDRGMDFNAGGARYYWSVINVAGLTNVIDSLLAVKYLVYDRKRYSPKEFIKRLDEQEPRFLALARSAPCFGVDDAQADALAADFTRWVFEGFEGLTPYLGGQFLPSSIQFTTYADAGKGIPATPDGRGHGAPLVDSIGPVHGKDTKGPTAMLNSVAKLPLKLAAGTPVLNMRLQKDFIRPCLKPLVQSYFAQGGMQVQISCIALEDMTDALEHPENHENLMVRIGGFSEYFNRLSDGMKRDVIRRTEHGSI